MKKLPQILQVTESIKDAYLRRIDSFLKEKLSLPAQSSIDRRILKRVFQLYAGGKLRVFEWGSGRSTVYYSRYLTSIGCDFEWYAIENSWEWQEKVALLVNRYGLGKRVHLHLSEFPAFWELPGWSSEERKLPPGICGPKVAEYVEYPRQIAGPKGFNVIIVDGRYRRRCLLVAAEVLAPRGLVVLHDAQRAHYHTSLKDYKFGRFFDSGKIPGSKIKPKIWIGTIDHHRISDIEAI